MNEEAILIDLRQSYTENVAARRTKPVTGAESSLRNRARYIWRRIQEMNPFQARIFLPRAIACACEVHNFEALIDQLAAE